ncbi:hypothetical protein DXA92_02860 [Agathobaculum butyriciproducens]|nr:hypothetical protein DXA92_02860 [Agathobaculum butyriciproducens]
MNIVVTERDKKLLRLVACLAIIVIFGMYLIRPAMKNHETLQNEYDAAEQKQQEYQTQIATLATIDDIIAQNEAALNTASEKYYKGDLETRQMDDIITGIALENGLFPQSLTLTEAAPGAVSAYLAEQELRRRTAVRTPHPIQNPPIRPMIHRQRRCSRSTAFTSALRLSRRRAP